MIDRQCVYPEDRTDTDFSHNGGRLVVFEPDDVESCFFMIVDGRVLFKRCGYHLPA